MSGKLMWSGAPLSVEIRQAKHGGYVVMSGGEVLYAGDLGPCLNAVDMVFRGPPLKDAHGGDQDRSDSMGWALGGIDRASGFWKNSSGPGLGSAFAGSPGGAPVAVDLESMMQHATRPWTARAIKDPEDVGRETGEQINEAIQEEMDEEERTTDDAVFLLDLLKSATPTRPIVLSHRQASYVLSRLVEPAPTPEQLWSERMWKVLSKGHRDKLTPVGVGVAFGRVTAIATPKEYVFFGDKALEEATSWLENNLGKVK